MNAKDVWGYGLAIAVTLLFVLMFTIIFYSVEGTKRDIATVCIENGNQWIDNNCIYRGE